MYAGGGCCIRVVGSRIWFSQSDSFILGTRYLSDKWKVRVSLRTFVVCFKIYWLSFLGSKLSTFFCLILRSKCKFTSDYLIYKSLLIIFITNNSNWTEMRYHMANPSSKDAFYSWKKTSGYGWWIPLVTACTCFDTFGESGSHRQWIQNQV